MDTELQHLVITEQASQIGQLMHNQTVLRAQLRLAEDRAARAEAALAELQAQPEESAA